MFRGISVAVLGTTVAASAALAQFSAPASKPTPEALFRNQCATCHTLDPNEPPRLGPTLAGVIGRHAGSVAGFHYSPGFAAADFTWDAAHIDAWLADPQAVIPGAMMPYRQANADTRHAIISYLEQH